MKRVRAGVLDVAYLETGPSDGPPVILLHGFPYDVAAYAEVAPRLAEAGCRVILPWLRGYGPTRFVSDEVMRSGQQSVKALDLVALMDALGIERAVLGGYDWGGRAACIVSALWPERVTGLVSAGVGYNIQDIAGSARPLEPAQEARFWYQHYFCTARGVAGLTENRRAICRHLWELWSPDWKFDDATFETSAAAFDNPDFVEVVIHSYRHRFGDVPGDPSCATLEERLQAQPEIDVPSVVLLGASDGVTPPSLEDPTCSKFTGPYRRTILPRVGHNVPQEAPEAFAEAVLSLL